MDWFLVDDCVGEYDECGECNGPGPDEYYDCDGNCLTDEDGDLVCDELDDCVGEYDSCGICEGADGNLDCLGECSGGFSAGSFMLSISTD